MNCVFINAPKAPGLGVLVSPGWGPGGSCPNCPYDSSSWNLLNVVKRCFIAFHQTALLTTSNIRLINVSVCPQTGNFQLLGVQLLGIVVISAWTASMTFVFLKVIDLTIGLRVSPEHERLGADAVMHGLLDTEDGLLPPAFGSRRKSCALHHEKTLWEHPLEQCSDAAYDNTELTPPPKTESFRRGSFLRNTLSHVVRRRESTCGTMPSYWSPGLRAQAGSRGRTQRNADFVSQSTEIGRFSSLRVNGLRQTQDVTLYL